MIGNLLARSGLWLLGKSSTVFGFTAQMSEEIRKFYATHPQAAAALGWGGATYAGKSVTEYSALNLSTVWACHRVISETVGSLPLHLMTQTGDGKEPATSHPLYWVLHDEPNPDIDDMRFRETLTGHAVIWGNAYALKVKRGGTGQTIGLWPWSPSDTWPDRVQADDRRVYIHKDGNAAEKTYEASDVFHLAGLGFDGVRGYSVVSMARQTLALADIQDEYLSKFYANGARRPYYLAKKTPFKTDQDYQRWREKWWASYGSSDGFHRPQMVEGTDIELKELGMPLTDAQLLQSRQFSVAEICRWFRIAPHLVADLARSTNNNIEQQALEFVQQTIMAWVIRWEKAINRQLLTPGEKGRYFAKHNLAALLRGDFQSRMAGYAQLLQNGVASINEVRDLEDWNPIEGGDAHHIQLNMQPVPGGAGAEAAAGSESQSQLVRISEGRRRAA